MTAEPPRPGRPERTRARVPRPAPTRGLRRTGEPTAASRSEGIAIGARNFTGKAVRYAEMWYIESAMSKAALGTAPQARVRRTQQERSAAMRLRLLDAAVDCLHDLGYSRTTTIEVAARAGVSRGAQL